MPDRTYSRFPLEWPASWPRTKVRHRAKFHGTRNVSDNSGSWRRKTTLTIADGIARLAEQLRMLGVSSDDWLISSNVRPRLDGLPRGDSGEPGDPAVAVYFRIKKADRVLACDRWDRVADNLAAVAAHIECIRGIDRYGVGSIEQAFAGYNALPARGQTWRTTLGFAPDQTVSKADIDQAFRDRARAVHPDAPGGSHDAMASLSAAKVDGYKELSL